MEISALDVVEGTKKGRVINESFGYEVSRRTISLPDAVDRQQGGVQYFPFLLFDQARPDNHLCCSCLVFYGHEHDAIGRARALASSDDASGSGQLPVWEGLQLFGRAKIHGGEAIAEQRQRMPAQRQAGAVVIRDDVLPFCRRRQLKRFFVDRGVAQKLGHRPHACDFPCRLAAVAS